jgi:hypothetical protein
MMTLSLTLPVEDFMVVTLALSNAVSAILILAMAQAVTRGAGFRCRLALIRGIQRVLMFGLAGALGNMAAFMYQTWWAPPWEAAVVFYLFIGLIVVGFIRHKGAPDIPSDASWGHPLPRLIYDRAVSAVSKSA